MYKRGIKGPTANVWRQRYFRCDQGTKIYYYKSADDAAPKGYDVILGTYPHSVYKIHTCTHAQTHTHYKQLYRFRES